MLTLWKLAREITKNKLVSSFDLSVEKIFPGKSLIESLFVVSKDIYILIIEFILQFIKTISK